MKRLVLFSDGTGNSSAKAEKTNVWRLFQALDQTTFDQLAKYDDGVGTSSNKYLAALGGAFGYGLKRNVIDLYKFVCRNYDGGTGIEGDEGDKIYGFGFSRGAFTIRIVAALIATQGLVKGRSESELHANALTAYRQYRIERFRSYSPFVILGRWLRDYVLMPWSGRALSRHKKTRRPESVPIEFLGLWDTVGAYGMPIDELKWGFDKLIWPMVAVDLHLSRVVRHCSHALALDEQRQTFTPTLFDESFEAAEVKGGKVPSGRLTQVWFSGVHSNVGGGYPEDQLSLVTMDWIASQAVAAGLRFNPSPLAESSLERSGFARIYDSRAGVAAYYRYRPRMIDMGRYPDGQPIKPIIHGSVIMRLAKGSDAYAPISLPAEFDVLAPDGQLIPMHGFPYGNKSLALRADRPKSSLAPDRVVDDRVKALISAINDLQDSRPQAEMVEQVRDTVWWRRVTYFATLASTLMLLAFPFASGFYASLVETIVNTLGEDYGTKWNAGVNVVDKYASGIVGPATAAAGKILPSYVDIWLHALGQQQLEVIAAIVMIAIPYAAGSFLGSRVHDRAWFAWHPRRRTDYVAWVNDSFRNSVVKAIAFTVVLGALSWFVRTTRESGPLVAIIHLAFYISLAILVWRLLLVARLQYGKRKRESRRHIPITPTLWVARKLRTARWLTATYKFMADKVVPIAVTLVVIVAALGAAVHVVYLGLQAGGSFSNCSASQPTLVPADGKSLTQPGFDASSVCWASGITVKEGRHYRAELEIAEDDAWWFDRLVRTDPAGFAGTESRHLAATMLKRSWTDHWFTPILRVGRFGLDEFPMKAICTGNAECKPQDYGKTPQVDALPVFSPIPKDLAKKLVAEDPHPNAPRAAVLEFIPAHGGELYLYVNDALLPWPPSGGAWPFYQNNTGGGRLKVVDITNCASATCDATGSAGR